MKQMSFQVETSELNLSDTGFTKVQVIDTQDNTTNGNKEKDMRDLIIYLIALTFRMMLAVFCTNSYHKPDQLFQGPEVAHHMVFGTGDLAWEWTFKDPIRNPLFPGFYAAGYFLLKILGLDGYLPFFSKFPYIQQAFLAALFDLMFVKINKFYNQKASTVTILIFNWGTWSTLFYPSRTYVNILEGVLLMVAFYLWLIRNENKRYDLYSRILVVVNFAVRGTSVIFWVIVWIYELFVYHRQSMSNAFHFIKKNLITIFSMLTFSIIVSSIYYQKLTWVDYNFFYYNVIEGWSKIALEKQFHAYFYDYQWKAFRSLVVPLVFGIITIFCENNKKNARKLQELLFFCVTFLIIFSLNGHKQLRFIFIIFPLIFVFTLRGFYIIPNKLPLTIIKWILLGIVIYHSMFEYGYRILKKNRMDTAAYIRDNNHIKDVFYYTPAYLVPMYAIIHRPDVHLRQIQNPYQDAIRHQAQNDIFLRDPKAVLKKVSQQRPNITHIIVQDDRFGDLQDDYQIQQTFENPKISFWGFPPRIHIVRKKNKEK